MGPKAYSRRVKLPGVFAGCGDGGALSPGSPFASLSVAIFNHGNVEFELRA